MNLYGADIENRHRDADIENRFALQVKERGGTGNIDITSCAKQIAREMLYDAESSNWISSSDKWGDWGGR